MSQAVAVPRARFQVDHPYLVLSSLYVGAFCGMYSETALNIALPQLSAAFNVELAVTQWLVVGYMLVIGMVLPFASFLMKWLPVKTLTLISLGSFFVGAVISASAPVFAVALIGRLIQGVGTGLVLPLMFAMVVEVVPPHKIGSAMGITTLVIMFAPCIAPTLAGVLLAVASWRLIFGSFAILLLVGLVLAQVTLVSPYELTRPKVDAASVLLSCLGFGGIVLGSGLASFFGWISVPTLLALVVGIVCLALYARRQLQAQKPMLDLRVFGIPGFRVAAACVMLNFGVTLSAMYVMPQFYQNSMLVAVALTGVVMLPGGVMNAVVSMISGRIFDRLGARKPAMAGFAVSVVAAILLLFSSPGVSVVYVVICHVLLMIGVPLAMSPCQTHALSSLPRNLSTDGSTVLNTLQQVLGAVCTAVTTSLLAAGSAAYYSAGGADSAQAFSQGSHYGYIFVLVLSVLGLLIATRLTALKRGAAAGAGAGAGAPEAAAASTAGAAPASAPDAELPAAAATASGAPATDAGLAASATQTGAAPVSAASTGAGASVSIAQLMKTDIFALKETDTALEALELFAQKGVSGAPVLNAFGELVGFVSDGDIIGMLSRQNTSFPGFYAVLTDDYDKGFADKLAALRTTHLRDIATRRVISVKVDDDVLDVCSLLTSRHLKKVPVLDAGGQKMVGMLNRSDITRYAVEGYREALKASAAGAGMGGVAAGSQATAGNPAPAPEQD